MITSRPFVILVTAILVVVVAFGARHQAGQIAGFAIAEVATFAWRAALLVAAATFAYLLFQGQLGEALRTALIWIGAGAVLVAGFLYRGELSNFAGRVFGDGTDIVASVPRAAQVEIPRGRAGEFAARAEVNGRRVTMLVDPGASAVVLTPDAAKTAGLPLDFLRFEVPVDTANGRARAAAVVIDRLVIGDIVSLRVPALVAEPGANLKNSVLGMAFLGRLQSFEVRGDRMVLRGRRGAS